MVQGTQTICMVTTTSSSIAQRDLVFTFVKTEGKILVFFLPVSSNKRVSKLAVSAAISLAITFTYIFSTFFNHFHREIIS
jgi:hypothetical protein